jgi:hypothetical protein
MKFGYYSCYICRNLQGVRSLVNRVQIGPNLGLSRYKSLPHICAAWYGLCRKKFTLSFYGRRYGRLRWHFISLLCYLCILTGMSQTKKTFLHPDQKKCIPAVPVLVPKSVWITLKIYANDAKCTALFTGQQDHSSSFLPRHKSINPYSTVMFS